MKKGETYYIIAKDLTGLLKYHYQHAVGLREFHVTHVGRIYVTGFLFERFGTLPNLGLGYKILTKKKKKKGKEIEFQEYDIVTVETQFRMNDLLTFGEAKLELIKYISNDFEDLNSNYDFNSDSENE
jgi:hypothetical protein